MKKLVYIAILVIAMMLSAFITYRVIMLNIALDIVNDTEYTLTIFGQTDYYSYEK